MKRLLIIAALAPSLTAQMLVNTGNHRTLGVSAPTVPTVRCSSSSIINSGAGATQTFSLPTCKTAGDLVIVFLGAKDGVTTGPVDWAVLQGNLLSAPANWGGMVESKLLTSSDVSTGTISVTFNTSTPSANVMFVEFIGTTGGTSLVDLVFSQNGSFTGGSAGNNSTNVDTGDVVLTYTGARNSGPITLSLSGGTTLQTQSSASNSGMMGYALQSTPNVTVTANGTISGSYAPSGVYTVVLTVHGGSFTPESIPGLEFGFDASCITMTTSKSTCATPSNGSTLSTWFNSAGSLKAAGGGTSGSNNNGSFTANGTCTFNTSQINGQPAVTFNGSSCYIGAFATDPLQGPGLSGVIVTKLASTAAKGEVFGGANSGPAYWENNGAPGKLQGNDKQNNSQTATGTATADTSWHQMNFTYTNNSGFPSYRLDRASDATINGTTSAWTGNPAVVGRDQAAANEFFNGQMAGVWWYNRVIRSDEITLLENYLHTRFGL